MRMRGSEFTFAHQGYTEYQKLYKTIQDKYTKFVQQDTMVKFM